MSPKIISWIAAAALATAAFGQSFNIDIGGPTAGGAGSGTPAPTFGGAAMRPGMWNQISGIGTGPYALVDLAGAPTAVACTRSEGLGGVFGWNNGQTTGWFQALMDDAHNTGLAGTVSYTFTGLAPGRYVVFTYAWSPLDPVTYMSNVSVPGTSSLDPQVVGGTLPAVNTFAYGVTHAVHAIEVGPGGVLTITCWGQVAGAINGMQLVNEFQLAISQTSPGAAVNILDSGGGPGGIYANMMTLDGTTFPNGPLFGIDLTIAEALALASLGPPFFGTLTAEGAASYVVAPPIPTGFTLYCVAIELTPPAMSIAAVTAPFSFTTQ